MERLSITTEVPHEISSSQELPVELLADVLRSIEQGNRLRCCAMVSKRWRQAANMATSNLEYFADRGRHPRERSMMDRLSAWLASTSYASMIQSIEVEGLVAADIVRWRCIPIAPPPRPVLQIPFCELRQLQCLKLPRCQLKATETAPTSKSSMIPTASGLVSLGALTALSRLGLDATFLDLAELSSCTGLQHLAFYDALHEPAEYVTAEDPIRFGENVPSEVAAALQHLTQLTHLELWYSNDKQNDNEEQLISTIFSALGQLQQLKELHVQLNLHDFRAEHLANLPISLRTLQLDDIYTPELSISTCPGVLELTQLQQLHLMLVDRLDPKLLSSLMQLTSLCLDSCPFSSPEEVSELLSALQMLEPLKLLELPDSLKTGCPFPQKYAALVAGRHLEGLHLARCCIPQEAAEYILSQNSVLTALSSLITSPNLLLAPGGCERLVACCPALQELCITDDESWDGDMFEDVQGFSTVSGLTALTKLSLDDVPMSDERFKDIGTCTLLKDLTLQMEPGGKTEVFLNGLMHLSNLTSLTHLEVIDQSWTTSDSSQWIIQWTAREASPDLHLQLQEAITAFAESGGKPL